jgi:tetratricopeptide (TPR) repeat protein
VNTTYRNFSGIVTEEGGQLKWSRFVAVDNQNLSKGFLWPSTEMEGAMSAYNEMRSAMMNLEFERAKAISDSLVAADPNWATAHLGQLQYHWVKRDVESLNATRAIAESKLEGASRAEAHFIKSYTTDRDAGDHHLEQALIFAPADPMVRVWYAWGQEDPERAIDIMKIAWDRLPEQGGVNNMMGYKYMAAGNMEKAKQHFEIFARANADVPNAYDSYGEYYLTVGDSAMAKEMYMKAYKLNNNWTASKERADEL